MMVGGSHMLKIGMISLGCAKNLVDSEEMLGMFRQGDYEIVNQPEQADVIVVNTCGFIESAKQESIDTILEVCQYGKKVVVTGCLVQRYLDELKKEIPEVDLWVPIRDYAHLPELINSLMENEQISNGLCPTRRILTTPKFTAYLKISDGCDNRCTYCAIPLIRGGFHSILIDELCQTAESLIQKGISELVVISQDTTRYGTDLENNGNICDLLKRLLAYPELKYIRLLYLYPDEISEELLELIAKEPRLTPYFDVPIQHASSSILASMHRRGDQTYLRNLFHHIREVVPNAILRTTLIVGFPGETEKDFQELVDFVKEIRFDHLGVFPYSPEDGTSSSSYPQQIEESVKQNRYEKIMKVQRVIAYQNNQKQIGKTMRGLVTSPKKNGTYEFRSGWNAPDDIDGKIFIKSDVSLSLGQEIEVEIQEAFGYDLYGILKKVL